MSMINWPVTPPTLQNEPAPEAPDEATAPARGRGSKILSKLRLVGLSLLIIYGTGVVFSHLAYSAADRTACQEAGGFGGLLWCPDWVEIEGYNVHFVNALVWPLDVVGARSEKIRKVEKPSTFVRHSPGAEFTKEREQTIQVSIIEAQNLLNDLGYKVGVPDGVIGPRTHAAISEFQIQDGMQMSGLVTDELIARLKNRVQSSHTNLTEHR